ncbi:MAG: hypothetical protein ACI9MR_004475 [Myxococcota bacterium]|jgi:hypothetical protein
MDRSTRFWDRVADRYARRPISNPEAYEKKLAWTRGYRRLSQACSSTALAQARPYSSMHRLWIGSSPSMCHQR